MFIVLLAVNFGSTDLSEIDSAYLGLKSRAVKEIWVA